MEMTGERLIPASRQRVWEALNDPEALRQAIPGCESVERIGDDQFQAKVAVKLGPMSAKFGGKVKLENLNPPASYTISGEGSGGAMGFAKGGADVALEETAPEETLLRYAVKAQVGGKIAQLGARLIDSTAKQMADQFFTRFAANLTPPTPVEQAPETGAPAMADTTGDAAQGSRNFPTEDRSAPEDATNIAATSGAMGSAANRAATNERVHMAQAGAVTRNTDTEFLGDSAARGPLTQHNAEGISASGDPVHRPNVRPQNADALTPLRLMTMSPLGIPLQAWIGGLILLAIAALMFL